MQQQTIGDHPLTTALVRSLRHLEGGLAFAKADIERLCGAGAALQPDALLGWIRELSILAMTLRNDIVAPVAAEQLERHILDPLCVVLDGHVAATVRSERTLATLRAGDSAQTQPRGPMAAIAPAKSSGGAGLRRSSTRRKP